MPHVIVTAQIRIVSLQLSPVLQDCHIFHVDIAYLLFRKPAPLMLVMNILILN